MNNVSVNMNRRFEQARSLQRARGGQGNRARGHGIETARSPGRHTNRNSWDRMSMNNSKDRTGQTRSSEGGQSEENEGARWPELGPQPGKTDGPKTRPQTDHDKEQDPTE